MSIRNAEAEDYSQIKSLWDLGFPEDSKFNQWFFKEYFKLENTIIYCLDKKICSMLQIFSYQLKIGTTVHPVHYIYGVCTHPQYRNQGFMGQLLDYACHAGKMRGDFASILIPQNNVLFKLYEKYGYERAFYVNEFELTCKGFTSQPTVKVASEEDVEQLISLYEQGTSHYKGSIIRNNSYWLQQIKMFKQLDGKVYLLQQNEKSIAYGFASVVKGKLLFQEAIGQDEKSLYTLVEQVALKEKHNRATVLSPVSSKGSRNQLGCIKFLQDSIPKDFCGYMNLMFN